MIAARASSRTRAGAPLVRRLRSLRAMKKHKLILSRSTIRNLSLADQRIAGGISGLRGCHSIQDHCGGGTGGALCASDDYTGCASGIGIATCTC